jgi:hypothetical protein
MLQYRIRRLNRLVAMTAVSLLGLLATVMLAG